MPFSFNPFTSKLDKTEIYSGIPISGADPYRLLWSDASSTLSTAQPQHRLSATENYGLYLDGNTTPYTGTNQNPTGINLLRTISDVSEGIQEGFYYAGINNVLTNNDAITGTVPDSVIGFTNFYANSVGTHTDTVNWTDGIITTTSYLGYISPTVTVTGAAHPSGFYGLDLSVSPTLIYNNIAGVYSLITVGANILVNSSVSLTNGSLTRTDYGIVLNVQGSAVGTSTGYGIWINLNSFDTNWNLYMIGDNVSYSRGSIWINELSGTAMLEVESDSTIVDNLILRAIASQSASYITAIDSTGSSHFIVQPNTSAAIPTMIVRTLFNSSDSVNARFTGPDRAVAANFDRFSWEFYLDDSNESQARFAEIEFVAQTVSASGRFGGIFFNCEGNSSSVQFLALGASSSGGVGVLFNNGQVDFDYQFKTDNVTSMLYIDGGFDTVTFGSSTSLAFVGIDGQSDEIQLLVQGSGGQSSANVVVFENSSGTDFATWNLRGDMVISPTAVSGSAITPTHLTVTGAAHTSLSNGGLVIPDVNFNFARTVTWGGGSTSALQPAFRIAAPTYAAGSAYTITDAATVYINAAPTQGTNMTLTRSWALYIDAGNSRFDGNVNIQQGAAAPTAYLHLGAGTTAASTAPLKFTSGTSMTAAEAGAMEFTTDDLFFTITTSTARKRLLMADPSGGLTSGRVPFATTNGRLTDDADFTFATDTLTVTKIAATEHTGNLTFADGINIVTNATTGTKIGTATTQKIGFYNATPIAQGASVADASGGAVIDAEARTAINALISRIEALGLIATV